MCCDICPFYDECEETGKIKDKCCPECPDYENCVGAEEDYEEEEEEEEFEY